MAAPLQEIKAISENIERNKLVKEFSQLEMEEGFVKKHIILSQKAGGYLNFIGILCTGIGFGILSLILNYLVFVWILHLEW